MFKFKLVSAVALAAGLAAPVAAQNSEPNDGRGFYVAAGIGIASVQDTDAVIYDDGGTFGGTGETDTASATYGFKNAAALRGTLGYDFGMFRGDLEIDYSRNKVTALTLNAINGTDVTIDEEEGEEICDYLEIEGCSVSGNTIRYDGGRVRQLSALANVWVDVPLGGSITPYAGGGLGISGFEVDGEGKARFAWQLGAGAAFNLTSSIAITADYRHRQAKRAEITWDDVSGMTVAKVKTNTFALGLRATF
ncbi:outer membrane protein [Allosphingosinicella vermicomposti]|uniref:outer membrane protein n=1 Tax=Allosphingosinicella vermicomposti TaxID=614671 RepID=UPI00131A4E1A|nr:outer membrane beta-barrel protein [Allosphingosinicella vermicomposti]